MKRGITTFIIVLAVSVFLVFILLVWESRLLLSITRRQTLQDSLSATYRAEFELLDIVTKFVNFAGFTPTSYSDSIGTGKRVDVDLQTSAGNTTLDITAFWPNATSKMSMLSSTTGNVFTVFNYVEIVIGFDCSSSMDQPSSASDSTPKIRHAQEALTSFMTNIINNPNGNKIRVGFIPFGRAGVWLKKPDLKHQETLDLINQNVWNSYTDAWVCNAVPYDELMPAVAQNAAGSDLGDPGVMASNYFKTNPNVKSAFILFSDGLANTSLASVDCGTYACSVDESIGTCSDVALEYLTCGVAKSTTEWKPGYYGLRPPNADAYAISLSTDPGYAGDLYNRIMQIFTTHFTGYYSDPNATDLPGKFSLVFNSIISSVKTLQFGRISQ